MTASSGPTAIAAAAVAMIALVTSAILAFKVRRLQSQQQVLLGDGERRDLIAEAAESKQAVGRLTELLAIESESSDLRFSRTEAAVARSISGFSLVRYDAFDEASGRQSVSVALLDGHGDGVVLSSLVRRDSARLYARLVGPGGEEAQLSPEEAEAVRVARGRVGER